ncbi:indolepyruvate ferredoxin oxidoreductase family protein [Oricola cellulosilytica]|uniref:Indolepyruvate ferredoxin oxidoreductase family protein n=1 Tax=Oricola cellulosilytica TaxID=1429082 RepID=A0A4R0P7K5_9HYPH|nr:indolepyruvate ferredoxin oxidoreductase family protein [Oricola cellulosilytica]TCD11879.1 indolepyruvate ferredoxin oxidoreductase family protein [Oricola cellulosilytica]
MGLHQNIASLDGYELSDRYARSSGRVFLTGTQALVRIVLDQRRRDRAAGLDTAGFVSGYRGSPLGGVDQEFFRVSSLIEEHEIRFLPAINEDLAATAMLGSQQVETDPDRTVQGVFGMWYGKGPGVDRAGDALKHGNAYGSSPTGGVLVVAGDDHGCVSSSMPHQSDVAFMTFFMPTLNPANVEELLTFGEYGYALSRFSGMWVGFKAISETVESAMSFELKPFRHFEVPDYTPPVSGLHYRWPDLPGPQIEDRMEAKKEATLAFAHANPIDRAVFNNQRASYGIVTTGKGHLDLMEALRLLGLDEGRAREIGVDVYKVGMVWPLEHRAALMFAENKRELLVVEEKRGIIESQLKEYFYDNPGRKPERMVGKRDENGHRLIPWTGELSPIQLAGIVATRLDAVFPGLDLQARAEHIARPSEPITVAGATRTPYFCSGCPHSTSTKVPEGSKALAGIGCHFMASWMDRETSSLIQMGGEGVNWSARSMFNGGKHIFQNLGEGTYHHSGLMAIRQAIAANTNITYKILFNDAVAMTGGQAVDGPLSVEAIAQEVRAEGVSRIAVVSDHPESFKRADFPPNVSIDHRNKLDAIQRELRNISGVTVLIYQQTCATEKRRLRKRGKLNDPKRFAVINELVCEGCGDCSVESNCLSVEPKETPFGRKRQINLNSCNKDFSCLNGFCPSFVTVEGAALKKTPSADATALFLRLSAGLPFPGLPALDEPYDLLVTGVGGTGVVTVGQIIAMAAHLEGKGSSVLDFMGFAQKFGPVLSYLRIGASEAAINQVRIENGSADAVIGCDLVVSSSPKASATYVAGKTRVVVNSAQMPTGDFTRNRDADLKSGVRIGRITDVVGAENVTSLDANGAAETVLGDAVFANILMLGAAWQQGLVPVGADAILRAIELNDVAVEKNKAAFAWGRIAAHDPAALAGLMEPELKSDASLDDVIARREEFLAEYQNTAWAKKYRAVVEKVRTRELAEIGKGGALTDAVARSLFKLMSYKDEYEVARLHTQTGFIESLGKRFEGEFSVRHHLAPPFLPGGTEARGRPRKREFGGWVRTPMKVLAGMKGLRGTLFDPFGYTAERRMERQLIVEFEATIDRLVQELTPENNADAAAIAAMIMEIRGYGPVKDEAAAKVRERMKNALVAFENLRT